MNRCFKYFLTAIVAVLVIAGNITAKNSPDKQKEKARYYYLEGSRAVSSGHNDRAYEYFKKAAQTDPDNLAALSAYGMQRLTLNHDSMQTPVKLKESLEMMKKFVDRYPGDFFESQYYAYVASRLDTLQEGARVLERLDSLFPQKTSTLINLAQIYMMQNRVDDALNALSRYERIEGYNPQITLQKMTYLLGRGDSAACVAEADALIGSNLKEPAYRVLKGNLFAVLEKPDSALACYLEAEKMAPGSGGAKMALANYYREQGDSLNYDFKIYEALLCEDLDLEEKTALLAEYLQSLLDESSDTERGDHLFEVLRDQYPHESAILDLAARYNAAKRDYDSAIEQIGYAIDLDPVREDFWGRLMTYQIVSDKYSDAIDTYHRAATHFTPKRDLTLLMASAANMDKDFERADSAYVAIFHETLPNVNPKDSLADLSILRPLKYDEIAFSSSLLEMMGDNFYKAGDLKRAFRAYDNSLFFLPDNSLALNNYAYFLTETGGDLNKAEEMSAKAIKFAPDNDTFLDTYAWVLYKLGRIEEALAYQTAAVEKAVENGDVSAELYDHFGDILLANGDEEGALENWKKALEIDPDNESVKQKLSKNY